MQSFSQVAMLGQTAFRLAKSPVFVTHQTENRQQLGLRELMFAETATVGRQNPVRDFERHPSKRHQADFGHLHLLPHQKTPSTTSRPHSNSLPVTRMSTEPLQVLYSGHLRKTGGWGSYRLVYATPHLALKRPPLATVFPPRLSRASRGRAACP